MFSSLLRYTMVTIAHYNDNYRRGIRSILHCALLLAFGVVVMGCGSSQQINALQQERDELRVELTEANGQIVILREKNASLEADIKGGRTAEEESKALAVRESGLNQREQELLTRKHDLDERETTLRSREIDAEQKVDDARKEAANLTNRWLIAIISLVVLLPLVVTGLFIWMRTRNSLVQPLTPQQAYMLEKVYDSVETPRLKEDISADRNEDEYIPKR